MKVDGNEIKNALVQYVRDRHNIRRGVVVAVPNTDSEIKFKLGFSLCKKGEDFDREMGLRIATGRAIRGRDYHIPDTIVPVYDNMVSRCERYYK